MNTYVTGPKKTDLYIKFDLMFSLSDLITLFSNNNIITQVFYIVLHRKKWKG